MHNCLYDLMNAFAGNGRNDIALVTAQYYTYSTMEQVSHDILAVTTKEKQYAKLKSPNINNCREETVKVIEQADVSIFLQDILISSYIFKN